MKPSDYLQIPPPKELKEIDVKALREAFGFFYNEDPSHVYKSKDFTDPVTKIHFNNSGELIDKLWNLGIPKDASIKNIGIVLENWYETLTKTPEYYSNMSSAPEYVVDPNTLPPDQLDELIKEEVEWGEKIKDTSISNKEDIDRALAKKREIANEQKTVTQTKPVDDFYSTSIIPPIHNVPEEKVEVEELQTQKQVKHAYKPIDVPQKFPIDPRLKDFIVTVVPKNGDESLPTATLTPEYVSTLTEYHQRAVSDPESFTDEIEEKITNSIPTEEKANIPLKEIERQAQKFVEISKQLPEIVPTQVVLMNGFSAFTALSDDRNPIIQKLIPNKDDLKTVVDSAQIMARVGALEQDTSVNLTSSFLPPELQQIYYGYTDTIEFIAVEGTSRQNEGINLNIESVVDNAQELKEIIKNAPKGEVDGSNIGFSSRQPVYIPTTETDLETKEKSPEELPWYKNSKHHTQADMYKRLHREPPVMVDAMTPSGEIISGNIIDSTFIPSKKGFVNTEYVKYTIAQDNQFIPEVTNENGEQIKFDNFNDYSNYLTDAKNFSKDYIPRIRFSDGKTLSFNSLEEYVTYAGNIGTVGETYSLGSSTSSLNSFFQKNKVPILTTAAVGAYSVNNLQLMNFITQSHSGQVLMYKGIGQLSFSVVNISNFTLGGIKKQVYEAGFEFGSKSLKLAIAKSGGKITSTALKIGTGTGTIATKALPKVISKILTTIGAATSEMTFGVSLAVGWVLGKAVELVGKIIPWEKVKKWGSAILGGIAGLIALPFFGIGGAIGAFAGVTLISTAFGGGLGGLSVAGGIGTAVGGIANISKIAMATALAGIAGPILFILLGFPVIVALILFIINSGAYVLPPSPLSSISGLLGADNPYVLVTKTASPKKLPNSYNSQTVTYTVTIKALKGELNNISITSSSCNVIKKDGSKINCPKENIPAIDPSLTVSPASDYSFTFTSEYNPSYRDALIYDTIDFSVNTVDAGVINTNASESVCIGDCAVKCVNIADNGNKWPTNLRANAENAVTDIMSNYTKFAGRVCPNDKVVNLCYKPSEIDPGYYAWHVHNFESSDKCDVYFNQKGLGSVGDAKFLITHELTHHIQNINGGSTVEYAQSGGFNELKGKGFCTYKDTVDDSNEAMAEANGLFASIPSWGGCVTNYKNQYPKNWIFANKFMR